MVQCNHVKNETRKPKRKVQLEIVLGNAKMSYLWKIRTLHRNDR